MIEYAGTNAQKQNIGTVWSDDAPRPSLPVIVALSEQEDQLSKLEAVLCSLAARIAPVLGPEMSQPEQATPGAVRPPTSEAVLRCDENTRIIRRLQDFVGDLNDRAGI